MTADRPDARKKSSDILGRSAERPGAERTLSEGERFRRPHLDLSQERVSL